MKQLLIYILPHGLVRCMGWHRPQDAPSPYKFESDLRILSTGPMNKPFDERAHQLLRSKKIRMLSKAYKELYS